MLLVGCGHPLSTGPDRIAVLPAAVLIGDPSQQWLATAIPLVLQQDLATSESRVVSFVPSPSAAYQLESTEVVRTIVEQRNGRFRIQATVTSVPSQKSKEILEEQGPVTGGIIPLLDSLARKIDPVRSSAFSTRKEEALRLLASAVNASDVTTRTQLLTSAVQADPSFGLAQIARVENASQLPDAFVGSPDGFVPLDRARWHALLARLQHKPLNDQANAEAAVLQLAPNNVEALASLGSQRFLQGKGAEGERLLRRAMVLNPGNLALSLQLAQGLVAVNRFAESAKILSPLSATSPSLLPTLALVQLLAGKTTEAKATFHNFISFLPAGNAATPALEAQWQRFTQADLQPPAPESIEFWQSAVTQSGDTNLQARVMLAAALDRAGRAPEARNIHVQSFIPEFTDTNAPVAFRELQRLNKTR